MKLVVDNGLSRLSQGFHSSTLGIFFSPCHLSFSFYLLDPVFVFSLIPTMIALSFLIYI